MANLKVLEIGGFAAGYAGRLFSHAGFDVVHVDSGEPRPAWVRPEAMDLYLHTNKRRIQTTSAELIRELASSADIVVLEAARASDVADLHFDDWSTAVKVAITPFGRTGPYRDHAATPSTILAMGGYTNLMGDPTRAPLTLPGHFVEFQTGGFAYTAATACLFGDHSDTVDIGMLEVVMAMSQFTTVMWHCNGVVRSRHGNDFWWVVPTNLFRCADGWVYINIVPGFWDSFTTLLDQPELTLDPRFTTNALRMENRDALHDIVQAVFIQWTRRELQERAVVARIPLGAVLSFAEVLDDEHLSERHMWQQVRTSNDGSLKSPRPPFVIPDVGQSELNLNAVETTHG